MTPLHYGVIKENLRQQRTRTEKQHLLAEAKKNKPVKSVNIVRVISQVLTNVIK